MSRELAGSLPLVAQPTDNSIDLERTSEPLPDVVERVASSGERIVIRRGGQVVAAIASAAELAALERERARWEREEVALRRISAAFTDGSLDEIDCRIAAALEAVRTEGDGG